jgi:hypothetical protein
LIGICVVQTSAQSFVEELTTASQIRLTVTNAGTVGNAFRGYRDGSNVPSCEYPANSGIEHLFEGGFWVGGLINGSQVAVSTSAYDASGGYVTGGRGFEFTTVGGGMQERSTLFGNPNFSPEAISHQDFVYSVTDENIKVPGTNINILDHTVPLNLQVDVETYNWNYAFSDFFVIQQFTITNTGTDRIDSVYFGYWANTVVRNVNVTPAGAGGAAFYNKGGNGYLDSLNMSYCYDHSGDVGFTESYVGQKFLGAIFNGTFYHPSIQPWFDAHYNAWQFNNTSDPLYFLPGTEQARYTKLTRGLNDYTCWDPQTPQELENCNGESYQEELNKAGNRSDLVSVGPFRSLAPGESFTVAYAVILGKKVNDGNPNSANTQQQRAQFVANAGWAQTAFNGEDENFNGQLDEGEDADGNGEITRYILPAPPDIPLTRVVAGDGAVDIYWSDNAESSVDPISREQDFEGYRIYLTRLGFDVTKVPDLANDLVKIAEFDIKGNGLFFESGLSPVRMDQPVQFDGDTTTYHYHYRLENISNGWQYAVAVTSFDRGEEESNLESLESSKTSNQFRVFAGKPAAESLTKNQPFVYPNPYYAGAAWEGRSNFQEQSRKLYFANLPEECVIRIFTAAGDFIDEIEHTGDYNGSDIRWYQTFGAENPEQNVFSGGEHAWDLLSSQTQIISRGLYLFTVEDLKTGKKYKGKFAIIK